MYIGSSAWPIIAHHLKCIYIYSNNNKKFTEGGREACTMMAAAAVYKIMRLRQMREGGGSGLGVQMRDCATMAAAAACATRAQETFQIYVFLSSAFFGWAGGGFAQPFKITAYILLLRTQISSSVRALSVEKFK